MYIFKYIEEKIYLKKKLKCFLGQKCFSTNMNQKLINFEKQLKEIKFK